MTKVDWLASSASLKVGSAKSLTFFAPTAKSFSHRKQGTVPEEMSQTMLTNKKQGKMRLRDATNIIKSTKLSINRKKYASTNFKSQPRPLFRPRSVNFCQNI